MWKDKIENCGYTDIINCVVQVSRAAMEEIIQHFWHPQHPLRRILADRETRACYGCVRFVLAGEVAYECSVSCDEIFLCLHEECAGMAREIRHPLHSSHPLTQADLGTPVYKNTKCAVCEELAFVGLGYICSEGCDLVIHLGCAGGVQVAADDKQVMKHPSHPQHELRFMKGAKRSSSFKCDACGTIEKGNSYTCSSFCDYWIHESCASLPTTAPFRHLHHHSLSLAYHPPYEYIKYAYTCGICSGNLRLSQWVYHCQLCRYVVHIKCATNTSPATTCNSINKDDGADDDHKAGALKFPINDMYEELIIPFMKIQGGEISIHHKHHHPLSFTPFSSSSSSHDHNEEDDVDSSEGSELTCDGCIMPIHESKSSISWPYHRNDGYMTCGECNYFLHMACFNLPPELPSHALHQIEDHKLKLQSCEKRSSYDHWILCKTCDLKTNGLFYSCTECSFKIDIKCASLPETIQHPGHPQQHHYLKLVNDNHRMSVCGVCYDDEKSKYYKCDNCTFCICFECVLLPASNRHRFEKHELPLTYDASVNHPSEFYCGSCELKMNPKDWMYHCRDCDQSFHPRCIPATSGRYRNISFGRQQYQVSHHLHHPIRFQIVSKKKRCDVCHKEAYDLPGYQCTSCNFVMCLGEGKHADAVKPID